MRVKLTHFCFVFIIFCSFRAAAATVTIEKGYYTIVAPGTIRPNSIFYVSFTLNDFHTSCWFNVSFTSFMKHTKLYEYESIEVEPRTTKLVELHVPSLNTTIANLEVLGDCGNVISKDIAVIYFETEKYWTFIQTNKAKYKPGELVQFRVICIDQLTRPAIANQTSVIVQIYDDQYNLVKKFFDIRLAQGVFKGELQLSKYPVLGLWKIKVLVNGVFTDKTFEVDRYAVPKFNVEVNTKKAIAIDDGQIKLEITTSDFYGEPIKGNLSISLSNTDLPWHKWHPTPPTISRESQINGNTIISIDLKNDLQMEKANKSQKRLSPFSAPITPFKFHIEATVIDESTGELSWTTTEIEVNTQRYQIELQAANEFDSDEIILNIKVEVRITDFLDNPIIPDRKTPIEIIVGCFEKLERYIRSYEDFDEVRIEYRNQTGENFSIINVINKNYTECYMYAEYQGIKSSTERMYKKEKIFAIDVLTESPEEGKELAIKISNTEPFEEFSYEIVSRKNIIQSALVLVPGNQTSYILRLNVTFCMVPKITIYAHHIKNTNFGGQMKDIIIKRGLQNTIEITTVNKTNPDTSVNINVTTDEGSYIGLMALDQRALYNLDEKDIFDEDYVNREFGSVTSLRSYAIPFYGRTADIITFSNAFPAGRENGPSGDFPIRFFSKRISKLLPESWLFNDFERTSGRGLNLLKNVPDTVTTWAITGFSLHPDTGLTFTENTTNLEVFQEFFVSMDFPSLIKEGEMIEVPIYVGNYMNKDALTNVTIESDSEDLEILEQPEAISKSNKLYFSKLISTKKRETFLIFLKPLKSGIYNLTVKAISSGANDVLKKTLHVKSQGIPYEMAKTYLVNLPGESIQEDEITIDIPDNVVSGSLRVEVSVVGDIFQPLIGSLQKMAEVPYVNGEDNMKLIVSNSIVLKYLQALNCSDRSLESKMKLNLELGYQNQLSFKYLDGSFGLFERKSERTGDIWQTIFSLWGLKQAKDFIHVDSKIIDKSLQYLKSKQQEKGCYKSENGKEDVKLTAFGLMVFLMDEHSRTNYSAVLTKGFEYLYNISVNVEHTPISIMAAYVLLLGNYEKAEDFLRKSSSHLITKKMVWTQTDTFESHLEVTASSLMNIFESQNLLEESLLQVVKGLMASKCDKIYVTQMIALQVMLPFVEKLSTNRTNLRIRFKDDQNNSGDFQLNHENSKVMQTFELPSSSRRIKLQSRGYGYAMVDVKYQYKLELENQSSSLTNISIEKYSNFLTYLAICSKDFSNNTKNKFIIMEINLQSGFTFTDEDFNDIEGQSADIKSIQYNDSQNKAVIYFEYIPSKEACIELEVHKSYKIYNSKPGWVSVYGTHDKDQKTTKSFLID